MARKKRVRRTATAIERQLRDADRQLAKGISLAEVCKRLGVSRATYHRWRARFGDDTSSDSIEISDSEADNESLRRIVVDLLLELDALKQRTRGVD